MTPPPPPDTLSALAAEVRDLVAARDWKTVAERLRPLAEEEPLSDPETAFYLADALRRVGETARALEVGRRVEAHVRRAGDHRLLLRTLNVVGMALFEAGRPADAEQYFSDLLASATEWGDEESAARASNNLGVLANVRGRRDLALTSYQRALAAYQRLGYTRGLAQTHYNLGISYRDLGFGGEADAHYARAVEYAEASESEDVVALAETERAVLRARSGDGLLAESMARRALARFERIGDPTGAAQAVRVMADAARVNRRDDLAAEYLERAYLATQAYPDPLLRAEVQRDRGLLFRDRGRVAAARDALADAEAHFRRIGAEAEADAVATHLRELPLPEPGAGADRRA